ncbi:hypothetical protein M2323_000667 [Rhodoblastus acidophilus]|uniref:hypothetical protein n=1 Tax=Rhodoblastus acidophilus TaxID=1074 RepID=UPI0022247067|nr:hypothetical protein [Rhodoblastus acidophilus]MCW2282902.1 hypothetical protein [Rhodoblastus acidophilus]MCW2331763.1 hypothetical protein [Rhodoblastus acidophilus]
MTDSIEIACGAAHARALRRRLFRLVSTGMAGLVPVLHAGMEGGAGQNEAQLRSNPERTGSGLGVDAQDEPRHDGSLGNALTP